MSALLGVVLQGEEVRVVPKHLLNLKEIEFAVGSPALARSLRAIGALKIAGQFGKTLLYDPPHVAEVVERWKAGQYAEQLARLPGGSRRSNQELEGGE